MIARLALLLSVFVVTGCSTSPGGPQYAELGIRTLDSSDQVLSVECLPLPVLPGGVVEKDVTLGPGLSAHVVALRDSAEVTLQGTNDPFTGHVTVSQPTLLSGYDNVLDVTTLDGETLTVVLFSPCSSVDAGT